MKVVYVVDSITDINKKINMIQNRFGDNIVYVVKSNLVPLFKTFGHTIHAEYGHNLMNVIHTILLNSQVDDIVIAYSSLTLSNELLNSFISAIGTKEKIVCLMPEYNTFEKIYNSIYNVYVKSIFKIKDSLVSNKLQFLPKDFVFELLKSHIGNRLFETNQNLTTNIKINDKGINSSSKTKGNSRISLICLIVALVLTMGLLACIAYAKVNYLVVLLFVISYVLDFIISVIASFKKKFDNRFLKWHMCLKAYISLRLKKRP